MNHHDKIQELRKAQIREGELIGELRAFLKNRVASIRKYADGQKVDCFDDNGHLLGEGIIDGCFCSASLDPMDIKKYSQDATRWNEEIDFILYRVNKIKKDGTKSSHHLAVCSEKKSKYNNYLVPIK